MNMPTSHSRDLLRVSRAAAGLSGSARPGPRIRPGITDKTIKIGISAPLTGPVAAVGARVEGIKDSRRGQRGRRRQDGRRQDPQHRTGDPG